MRETGVTFSDYSVRAILADRKTQTRRLARELAGGGYRHRFGGIGDQLWCREAWRTEELEDTSVDGIRYRADNVFLPIEDSAESAVRWIDAYDNGKYQNAWRTPIYMRRWMARVHLELDAEVRLERLQDITEEDAIAELGLVDDPVWRGYFRGPGGESMGRDPLTSFAWLWGQVHPGDEAWDSWASNPFIWRISFRRIGR